MTEAIQHSTNGTAPVTPAPNDDYAKTFRLFHVPGCAVEVRAFLRQDERGSSAAWAGWSNGLVYGYFDDETKFVQAVRKLDKTGKCEAIYATLNPVASALLARANNRLKGGNKNTVTTSDEDIVCRRWLFTDVDPVRPAGISATNEESAAAGARAKTIRDDRRGGGWPDPALAPSGNGCHLLYSVDLPNDEESRDLAQRVTAKLAEAYSDETVGIDVRVFNAARITKIYGTMARKGDATEDRPHRRSGFIAIPDLIETVTAEQLQQFAPRIAQAAGTPRQGATGNGTKWTPERFLQEALARAGADGRNNTGLWLAAQLRDQGYSEAEASGTMRDYAASVTDPSSYRESEALASLRQAYKAPAREPRADHIERGDDGYYDYGYGACPDERPDFSARPSGRRAATWPYAVVDGRLSLLKIGKDDEEIDTPIADFTATITEQILYENGDRHYVITGEGKRGGAFQLEIGATDYSDNQTLKAALQAAAGAKDPVHAGMVLHLGPAISKLTDGDLVQSRRYTRTGWSNDGFLLPGREAPGVSISLPAKLPFGGPVDDLADGLTALDDLIRAPGAERGAVILAAIMGAPLARRTGAQWKRYSTFVKGRTGALKTSAVQAFMGIFGQGYLYDENLLKWGEGATRNAIMAMAGKAADLPFLIDNYKPQTGGGPGAFYNLIQNILEGGDKERLTRNSELRESAPIHCWPICTGEDIPDGDAASVARNLVIEFAVGAVDGKQLSNAQAAGRAGHLAAVGAAWLDYLESAEGKSAAVTIGGELEEYRDRWFDYLLKQRSDMVNPLRVAQNLATNELSFLAICAAPGIGAVAQKYIGAHKRGLELVAEQMASSTTETLEAHRFLAGLRQIIAAGRGVLVTSTAEEESLGLRNQQDRIVGWKDGSGGAFLYPEVARNMVERLIGDLSVTAQTLHDQLQSIGAIGQTTKGRRAIKKRVGTHSPQWMLHIKGEHLELDDTEEQAAEKAAIGL